MSLHLGDCLAWLATLPENSVDAIVTDPPYGLAFMGKAWDALPPGLDWAEACLRVLKPGGHLVAFGGTRTAHRLTVAIEDAGFEIRDSLGWVYYSGFPKSLDVSKALDAANGNPLSFLAFATAYAAAVERSPLNHADIDRHLGIASSSCYWARSDHRGGLPPRHHWERVRDLLGLDAALEALYAEAERETIGRRTAGFTPGANTVYGQFSGDTRLAAPATPEAIRWSGWGTAVKPAIEPAVLARKPLDGTVAANVQRWGTGALNIDGCRLAPGDPAWVGPDHNGWGEGGQTLLRQSNEHAVYSGGGLGGGPAIGPHALGRWPANLYYCPKAPRAERERGTDGLPVRSGAEAVEREEGSAGTRNPRAGAGRTACAVRNFHPTVKPVRLMRWLCRLVTPPGGRLVDTFAGSGSTLVAGTLEGFVVDGAEREPEYHAIAAARHAHAIRWPASWADTAPGFVGAADDVIERVERLGQVALFGKSA